MEILFLSHTFPYPLNEGTRVLVFNLLKQLGKRHSVHLICTNDEEISADAMKVIRALNIRVVKAIPHAVPQSAVSRLSNMFLDDVPFCVRQFESGEMRRAIREFLSAHKTDVVHAEYISSAVYRKEWGSLPSVFYPHDAVSMLFERNIQAESNFLRRAYTRNQWKKVLAFEAEAIPEFSRTVVVSPVDKDYLSRHAPSQRIKVIPLGIDCDYFSPQPSAARAANILFRGVMNFLPNDDAARFFYESVFPQVKREFSEARFLVAGKGPSRKLISYAEKDPSLELMGFVEDLRVPMAEAAAVVCPMRIGSGMKIKLLESLAMGKAVVATTLACAGLPLKNGDQVLIADTPQDLAAQTVRLLKDETLRFELGLRARAFVTAHYSWEKMSLEFESAYREAGA